MRLHNAPLIGSLLVAGCFGGVLPDGGDDAIYGVAPDLAGPICTGNNDGVIDRGELAFPLGATVNYLFNPGGTTVQVNPDGVPGPGGPRWELSSLAGDVRQLTIEPIAGKWYEGKFPGATYATLSDVGSGTLGVFRVTDDALLLLGFVSDEPQKTLLVYDQPVVTLHFPVRQGDGWVTGSKLSGTLDGVPHVVTTDTYTISIDARGTAVLPYLEFQNTLRVHVELSQALLNGKSIHHIQHLYFHECVGELGRMVSNAGESNASFTTAAEFRRLAL